MPFREGSIQGEAASLHYLDWAGDGPQLTGHLLPQERPDEVARLIEGFLAD